MSIAVCIPTYNQSEYLEGCIESVMRQTHSADEIIISNDCSTDNTSEVLQRLKDKFPQLIILNQPRNVGLTQNSNSCMKAATADYIVRMGSDDLLLPDFNLEMSLLLDKYKDAGYSHCNLTEIDENGKKKKLRKLFRKHEFETESVALKQALKGYKVAGNIIMYRKSALEKAGFLKSPYNFAEDFYLAADLAAHGYGNCFANKVLASYRVWNDNNNIRVKRKLEEIKGLTCVFEEVIGPAFKNRKYSLNAVNKAKGKFAKSQANCLSWDVFTVSEKQELKKSLLYLSSAISSRFTYYLSEHNLNGFINMFKKGNSTLKQLIKSAVSN